MRRQARPPQKKKKPDPLSPLIPPIPHLTLSRARAPPLSPFFPPFPQSDLMQYADRDKWYVAKFAADDAPDWNPAAILSNDPLIPGVRLVRIEVEASRERVPLRNAYTTPGQRAGVRLAGGANLAVRIASPPPPHALNARALQMTKGDIYANEIKSVREPVSARAVWELWVPEEGDTADLAKAGPGDPVEVGPCVGTGLNLKGPIAGAFTRPTLVLFVSGAGAATARALVEASADGGGGLAPLSLRRDVVIYYKAPTARAVAWGEDAFAAWGAATNGRVRVVTSTRETFAEMFDFDDALAYDPAETAVLILTGGPGADEEAEAEGRAAAKEAEVSDVVSDAEDAPAVVHTDTSKVL